MLKWVGVAALSGAAGIVIGASAVLFFSTSADETDGSLESAVAAIVAEPAVAADDSVHNGPSQLDSTAQALDPADVQRILSRSGSAPVDGRQDEAVPTPESVPTVTYASGAPAGEGEGTHVVTEGETLWDVSVQSGVGLQDLAARNGLGLDARIAEGDTLIIPVASPPTLP
jgi:LysM repeat protein